MDVIELLKVIFLGIVEGITEWLPISSTGHMLLVDELIKLNCSESFKEMFFVVIQLGAIMAVVLLFWNKLWPFQRKCRGSVIRKDVFSVWFRAAAACIPGALVTVLFDDYIEARLHTPTVIAIALIFYGIVFIIIERINKNRAPVIGSLEEIDYKTALLIGLFQVLSVIPGTSRSGATIIGALTVGVSRTAAAEFTFFLAVPVMIGLSFIKILGFGFSITPSEGMILAVGCLTAFLVSLAVIKGLMAYIKKRDFRIFGLYRIVLGCVILMIFL